MCVCACLLSFFKYIASVFFTFALPSYILTAAHDSYRKEHRAKVGEPCQAALTSRTQATVTITPTVTPCNIPATVRSRGQAVKNGSPCLQVWKLGAFQPSCVARRVKLVNMPGRDRVWMLFLYNFFFFLGCRVVYFFYFIAVLFIFLLVSLEVGSVGEGENGGGLGFVRGCCSPACNIKSLSCQRPPPVCACVCVCVCAGTRSDGCVDGGIPACRPCCWSRPRTTG